MSGKSFDDNLSFTEEHIATTHSIVTVHETNEQIQSMSQDGEKKNQKGQTSLQISDTQETKSTGITPVPPTTVTTSLSSAGIVTAFAATDLAADGGIPKPKPRLVRTSSPTDEEAVHKSVSKLRIGAKEHETSLDVPNNLDSLILPVPKPRFQVRASDSIRNLEVLNEQQNVQQEHQPIQSDSISLRSFDYTEETSRTDDPSVSVSISIKSQPIDYPITTTATTTTSEEPGTDSIDPPSELSNDDVSVETERKTSFYIGESSRNIITKTTPTKPSTSEETMEDTASTEICPASGHIEATDVSLMKEVSVDSDEENDVFKEYVTMQTSEPAAGLRIRRQSSETRNDLLEEDIQTVKESVESTVIGISTSTTVPIEEVSLRKTSTEQSFTTTTITSTTSTGSAPLEVIHSTGEDDSIREISESMDIEIERPVELDLPLEKSDWETAEKEIPPSIRNCKVVHSPQPHQIKDLTKERITEEMVKKTLDEVQESLDAVNSELKAVLKDVKSIKESPSEFEFRSFAQTLATTDVGCEVDKITDKKPEQIIEESIDPLEIDSISSFIGVPENMQDQHGRSENTATASSGGTLTCKAVMTHCAQDIFIDKKPDLSLGFVSTGTAESQDSLSGDNIIKEERASLGFISSETAEDFSSMEEYYHEKFVKADIVTETKEPKEETTSIPIGVDAFGEITSDLTMKAFEDVVHRIKTDNADTTQNRWSVPEIDHSQSSSESYYKSFEKSESRPLSSDVEVLMTQGYSSEYQTAADASSVYRDTTDFVTAASIFESSSGKTISSHESMRSLDSHSETSANLGSIDVSDLSETLVASSTEEAEEIRRLRDLTNEDDSDASLDLEPTDYTTSEVKVLQQTQMKRSQEMIFKPKFENISRKSGEEVNAQEIQYSETEQLGEYTKLREIEKTRGLVYPMEEIKVDDLKVTEDILLYHEGARRSIDESKYSSSLDEGSIISVSLSSTSNIDTVVENFEDIVGSVGASSLAGIEGIFGSSLPEEPSFTMEMDAERGDPVLHESTLTAPLEESSTKRGHKRSDSTSVSGEDLKNLSDKDVLIPLGEGKESESESDTDPYETEYARQFRSPTDRKTKKKKQTAAEIDYSFEGEKRPFTPSQLIAEVIVEDTVTEELEAEDCLVDMRRPSQNMHNYANIPNITVTEDAHPKSPILKDTYEEKTLYKVKTEEELHKATDDRPLHEEKEKLIDIKEENFQKLVQEQYKQKLAELKKAEIGDSDYDYNKTPDSPDSFEMVDQPDISDEFVIIEEVAKEANEDDLGGKSIRIAPIKYESKHDEEVEKIIIKSAPADPKLGSQIFRDDLNFELEESPPTGSSGGAESEVQDESDAGQDMAANNKRWVEMQLTENQLRYPYDLTGGVLEDIKEEDGEFEVGSSRISSFKDSFSSTPDYDVMAARRYYAARGEHDDISMSSLQEFESLEQAISLENRNRTHQGSTDSSNGSFQRRYILRTSGSGTAQGDDISISSLKEFEGLENACIEAHLIEIKAKEEAALLSRSDESNKSNGSDRELLTDTSKAIASKVTRTVTHTEVLQSDQQIPNIETLLKQKLLECERAQSSVQIMEISKMKTDSDRGSEDCLDMNRSVEMLTSSVDESFEFSKDGTTKSDIHSLELDKHQPTREEGIESIQIEHMDDAKAKFGVTFGDALTTTATTMTTSTDADGREHTTVTTRIVTKSTLQSGDPSSVSLDTSTAEMMTRDISADSLNQISVLGHTTTSSAGTTAIYQTSAGNSQMSGSVTSCASSTLMEDSAMSTSGLTMSTSYWSHEEETFKEGNEIKPKEDPSPH